VSATVDAIRIHRHGGPEELRWEEIPLAAPGAGEVRVRHTAIAVNFSDVNVRRGGFYLGPPPQFPLVPGNEAAGVVETVGPGVAGLASGERVAYVGTGGPFYENTGAYAEARNVPAACLVKLPDDIPDEVAASLLLKGLTAALVITRLYTPRAGEPVLVHGAASGVGLLVVQWAKHLGATVLGTVGSPAKARVAREHGCDHPILYREADFVAAVRTLVPDGVAAVYDGVGKDTFVASFDCVRRFGTLVNYGNASGHVPPFDLLLLGKKGSLTVSRAGYSSFVAGPGEFRARCGELFDLVRRGVLKAAPAARFALRDAATAHREVEARRFAGAIVLVP
jgi:NADPH2:quinone reductase